MKILKFGKEEFKESIYKATCEHCGCEFEFEGYEFEDDYPRRVSKIVRCPCCSRKIEYNVSWECNQPREITIQRYYLGDSKYEDAIIEGEQND